MTPKHLVAVALVMVSAACSGGSGTSGGADMASDPAVTDASMAPMFEVDPLWPKPLPNHWLLGSTIGVSVDSRDHVWIVHRGNLANNEMPAALDPPIADACCFAAPPVLEFNAEGTLVQSWGGPGDGYDWPTSNHGIVVDHMDNVWIGGNGGGDSHVLKFSRAGQFLLQAGEAGYGVDSNAENHYSRVAKISFDGEANEMYLADGYGNKRVAVIDASSGDLKRFWGAYGNVPNDDPLGAYDPMAAPAQQFRGPVHCADPSDDNLVYVCDRGGDRVQVFQTDGTFVDEIFIEKNSGGSGAVWDVAFSPDPGQTFMFVADGLNQKVHVVRRDGLQYVYNFGDGGRNPGQFYGMHSIATDSRGNIFTTETYEGKRLQKHLFVGMGAAPSGSVGVARPE
ncbi:MAG TPA: hypothetical protein EYQ64_14690 [Gemmatimonadetes bacterium]|nr:hypothetical protein [Gemmatimonadota bacterium]